MPLLPRMPVPNIGTSKAAPQPPAFNNMNVIVSPTDGVAWPAMEHSYRSLGWIPHALPDSSVYYSNANLRVVTDIDLRTAKKLEFVMDYLDKKRPNEPTPTPLDWELWLHEAGAAKASFDLALVKSWVNHKARILILHPPVSNVADLSRIPEDDSKSRETVRLVAMD
jgi:hypothetical protein